MTLMLAHDAIGIDLKERRGVSQAAEARPEVNVEVPLV
jgi:hypothetical protein